MKSFRSKPIGWQQESYRHYLAAKGIKTRYNAEKIIKISEKKCRKCGARLSPFMSSYKKGLCENCEEFAKNEGDYNRQGLMSTDFYARKKKSFEDMDKSNKESLDEIAADDSGSEIRDVIKEMEEEYVAEGLSKSEAKKRMMGVLKTSPKAFEKVVMWSDDPDKYFSRQKPGF